MKTPAQVAIVEVGPRDGLQNLSQFLPTDRKIRFIELLAESGLKNIEVTSFVHPKAVPQFRDAQEVFSGLAELKGIKKTALVPNVIGVKNALAAGATAFSFVFSLSESHNLRNVNKTREESLIELSGIQEMLKDRPGISLRVVLSVVFGCPFEGQVRIEDTLYYLDRLRAMGVTEVILADTVGYGRPRQVREIIRACRDHCRSFTFGVHFHNTRGLGLANVLVCLEEGIAVFDSSLGGLGGCPFVPGATGNIATEDLVFMLEDLGIASGVNLDRLLQATRFIKECLPEAALSSSLFQAGLPGREGQSC